MMTQRYCLALDLKDDPALIAEYEVYHRHVWPQIIASIRDSGIEVLDIYRTGNRLLMIMETDQHFTFEKKTAMDAANAEVQRWENLMWNFQQPLPWAKAGQKWILMDRVFSLPDESSGQ